MNSFMNAGKLQGAKIDATKYNLRCIRNVSEKMMKKDFIYDMRSPLLCPRKVDERKQTVLPLQFRKKDLDEQHTPYQITAATRHNGLAEGHIAERRILNFRCNFCREEIATLFSLATHVKSHYQKYCKKCYWILLENETMEQHLQNSHGSSTNYVFN